MMNANTEQTTELKAALQDVIARARRDGRYLDVGVCEAAHACIDAPRLARAEAEAVAAQPARRGRKPRSNGVDAPASVSDLGGGR